MRIPFFLLAASAAFAQQQPAPPVPYTLQPMYQLVNDYGNQRRYAADNQKLAPPAAGEERVVFMGDSITDGWGRGQFTQSAPFFPGKPYVNRGISGQVTAQMLLRFYPDAIALKPKAVVFGPTIVYDAERCIVCTRCIRVSEEIAKDPVL